MCGILGIVAERPLDRELARSMRDAMAHRGPDAAGEAWFRQDSIALLHRRLAVIDLNPQANQPMFDATKRYCIVYNGEIYNFRETRKLLQSDGFRFATNSDTEVLLGAYIRWGISCLDHLRGMFALAILDLGKNTLFAARDRAGEKPFFYLHNGRNFAFASELKALLRDPRMPREISAEALDCYLAFGYVPGWRCLLKGYRKLPPAHALELDLETGALRCWRYWYPPAPPAPGAGIDTGERRTALVDALEAAVEEQLVADVPVGVLLSGGVDSSIVAALAARSRRGVRTFTIRFPGRPEDESSHARKVARFIGSEHEELEAGAGSLDLLPRLAEQFDEPMADSSAIPTFLVSELIRRECTVALGGDGGDELFGGYHAYTRLRRLERWAGWIPLWWRRQAARSLLHVVPRWSRGRGLIRQLATEFSRGLPNNCFLFDERGRKLIRAQLGQGDDGRSAEDIWIEDIDTGASFLDRVMRKDFETYLCDDVLVKVDRASMCVSLEVRAPFLDRRVMELALGTIPVEQKVTSRSRKIFLKEACRHLLPADFDFRRKQGFYAPVHQWFMSSTRTQWASIFADGSVAPWCGLLDELVGPEGSGGWGARLYALTMLELWRRRYGITV